MDRVPVTECIAECFLKKRLKQLAIFKTVTTIDSQKTKEGKKVYR